ncbi:hypothetical protein GM418_08670 [Maribellus comscasis]|uniref:Uncharacterized protein n=2 Tax=Maribellus comscasis TaxID=2681766 RepID=A0A6I6JU74_9BACT|nr:hypothetical protein GM418_08670 [Maribellus comscasis]
MFFLPVIIILVCRVGIAELSQYIPFLTDYYWLIVAGFTSVTASTPAFLVGFILLDERDENIHTVLKILPLPENFILKIRTIFMMVLGFVFSFLILAFNGLVYFTFLNLLTISILFALIPPVLTFSMLALAKNKIEAATIYKALSVVIFLPVVAFFTPDNCEYFFGVIPFFWTYKAIQSAEIFSLFSVSFLAGITTHTALAFFLYRLFQKKWFS